MRDLLSRGAGFWVAWLLLVGCGPKSTLITVTPSVGANGSLTFDPPGPYEVGSRVTLTATPAAGYIVDTWGGTDDDTSRSAINHLTVTSSTHNVSVTFKQAVGGPFHLTLPGSVPNGTLAASPVEPVGGYPAGAVVTLTAAPNNGFVLDAWNGTDDPTSASLTNQVTMIADETVGVSFRPGGATFLLTLTPVGNLTVVATSSVPNQLGPSYTVGTVVTLSATVAAGHKVNWTNTDNDSSHAVTNTVTLGAAPKTVTAATVCDSQCTLVINVDFPAFGHVTAQDGAGPLPVNTSGASTHIQYNVGHTITLTAHDSLNWPFQGWSSPAVATNDCVGSVVMNVDQTVSASFPDIAGPGKCP
jgi:hypothetical protein